MGDIDREKRALRALILHGGYEHPKRKGTYSTTGRWELCELFRRAASLGIAKIESDSGRNVIVRLV